MRALVKFQYRDHNYTATVNNLESLISYLQNDDKKADTIEIVQTDSKDTAEKVWHAISENMKNGQVLVSPHETLPGLFETIKKKESNKMTTKRELEIMNADKYSELKLKALLKKKMEWELKYKNSKTRTEQDEALKHLMTIAFYIGEKTANQTKTKTDA